MNDLKNTNSRVDVTTDAFNHLKAFSERFKKVKQGIKPSFVVQLNLPLGRLGRISKKAIASMIFEQLNQLDFIVKAKE